jgi:hypothetical protein
VPVAGIIKVLWKRFTRPQVATVPSAPVPLEQTESTG